MNQPPLAEIPRGEYAFPGPLRDALVGAILSGAKTSTTCLLAEFTDGEDLASARDALEAVVDSAGNVVCVTRTTDVEVVRLGDVALDHVIAEGEGYTTVAEWRCHHEAFWRSRDYVAEYGNIVLDDDTLVVCFRFDIDRRYPLAPLTRSTKQA